MRVCPEGRFGEAELEGTPFQMPTRLADGLGPGSDPKNRFPGPSTPQSHDDVQRWVPRVDPQEGGATLAANGCNEGNSHRIVKQRIILGRWLGRQGSSLPKCVDGGIPLSMNTSRRHFLSCASAGLGMGLLSPELSEAADSAIPARQRSPLKIGLVTYNLAKDWDIATILKNCSEARFDGVELRTTHNHKVEVSLSAAERSEVRKQFADSSVELMGLGSAFDYHTPDPAKLRADIEATKAYIILAQDVGATGVKVRPNGLPKEVPVEKTLEQIGRSLGELGQFAHDHGQVIRLEVHGPGTSRVKYIRTILDFANHPSVGACWNSNQTDLEDNGFDANFGLLKGQIFSVHMRDLYLEEYPFRQLLNSLVASGFRGYTMAEIPESADPVRVMRYFRGLWLSYQGLL